MAVNMFEITGKYQKGRGTCGDGGGGGGIQKGAGGHIEGVGQPRRRCH
jgi:hypothetical protein